jgi:hypothetical protein
MLMKESHDREAAHFVNRKKGRERDQHPTVFLESILPITPKGFTNHTNNIQDVAR